MSLNEVCESLGMDEDPDLKKIPNAVDREAAKSDAFTAQQNAAMVRILQKITLKSADAIYPADPDWLMLEADFDCRPLTNAQKKRAAAKAEQLNRKLLSTLQSIDAKAPRGSIARRVARAVLVKALPNGHDSIVNNTMREKGYADWRTMTQKGQDLTKAKRGRTAKPKPPPKKKKKVAKKKGTKKKRGAGAKRGRPSKLAPEVLKLINRMFNKDNDIKPRFIKNAVSNKFPHMDEALLKAVSSRVSSLKQKGGKPKKRKAASM